MRITAAQMREKLATLMEIEGFSSIEELVQAVLSDTVSPAICMNEGCGFTCEMESCYSRNATFRLWIAAAQALRQLC